MNELKVCKRDSCKKTVKGRADRVFCTSYCKSVYHYNIRKATGTSYFKMRVDDILRKNRAILARYNERNGTVIKSEELLNAGFNPSFYTHTWQNLSGDKFIFCYDQGYHEVKSSYGDKCTLAKWQKEMERQLKM